MANAAFHAPGLQALIHPFDAEITGIHRAGFFVQVPGMVGAGLDTGLAPDAFVGVCYDDAVFSARYGILRTDLDTGGIIALHAMKGEKMSSYIRIFSNFRFNKVEAGITLAAFKLVGNIMHHLADHITGPASDALT
jgi:hypothetical protein